MPDSLPFEEKHINLLNALRPFVPEGAGDFIELFAGYAKMARNNRLDPDSVKEFASILNSVQEKQALRAAKLKEAHAAPPETARRK